MEYAWKKGFPWGNRADPALVAERIKALASNGKHPTAYDVLEDGRNEASPQHDIFEWEDSIAAESYRVVQANQILRSVVIIRNDVVEPRPPIRAFVHVIPPGERDAAYVDIVQAMQNPGMRQQVLEKAMAEIDRWREKYEEYTEFTPIVKAIDKTRGRVKA